ncbi:homoserine O-acetyltransferase/O-succinyltransferase family protein [Escherichia coli]
MMSLTGRNIRGAGVVETSRYLDAVCLLGGQAALNILMASRANSHRTTLWRLRHHILHSHALLTRGFDDSFLARHSRYADFPAASIRDYTYWKFWQTREEGDAYLFASKISALPLW